MFTMRIGIPALALGFPALLSLAKAAEPTGTMPSNPDPKEISRYNAMIQWIHYPENDRTPESVYDRERLAARECGEKRTQALRQKVPNEALVPMILLASTATKGPGSPDEEYRATVREHWREVIDAGRGWLECEDPLIRYLASCMILETAASVRIERAASVDGKNGKALDAMLQQYGTTGLSFSLGQPVPAEVAVTLIAKGQALISDVRPEQRILGMQILSRCGRPGYVAQVAKMLLARFRKEQALDVKQSCLVAMTFFWLDADAYLVDVDGDHSFTPNEVREVLSSKDRDSVCLMEACLYIRFARKAFASSESSSKLLKGSLNGIGVSPDGFAREMAAFVLRDSAGKPDAVLLPAINALRYIPDAEKYIKAFRNGGK